MDFLEKIENNFYVNNVITFKDDLFKHFEIKNTIRADFLFALITLEFKNVDFSFKKFVELFEEKRKLYTSFN